MSKKPPGMKKTVKHALAKVLSGIGAIDQLKKTDGLIILMFHKVNDLVDPLSLTVSRNVFSGLMRELQKEERVVPLDGSFAGRSTGKNGLRFAVTFDDGYKDNYEVAFPIMEQHQVPATIYISTDYISQKRQFWYEKVIHAISNTDMEMINLSRPEFSIRSIRSQSEREQAINHLNFTLKQIPDYDRNELADELLEVTATGETFVGSEMLTWNDVRALDRGGIQLGSHTVTHPILSNESVDRIREEVRDSKEIIESEIGKDVRSFAYPNGTRRDINAVVLDEVDKAGYQTACTTIEGINTPKTPCHMLYRINVFNGMCTDKAGSFDHRLFWLNISKAWLRRR